MHITLVSDVSPLRPPASLLHFLRVGLGCPGTFPISDLNEKSPAHRGEKICSRTARPPPAQPCGKSLEGWSKKSPKKNENPRRDRVWPNNFEQTELLGPLKVFGLELFIYWCPSHLLLILRRRTSALINYIECTPLLKFNMDSVQAPGASRATGLSHWISVLLHMSLKVTLSVYYYTCHPKSR